MSLQENQIVSFELGDDGLITVQKTPNNGQDVNYVEFTTVEVDEANCDTTTTINIDEQQQEDSSNSILVSTEENPHLGLELIQQGEGEEVHQILTSDDILIKYENYIQCDTCYQIFDTQENFNSHINFCTPASSESVGDNIQIVQNESNVYTVPQSGFILTSGDNMTTTTLQEQDSIPIKKTEIGGGRRKQRIESRQVEEGNFEELPIVVKSSQKHQALLIATQKAEQLCKKQLQLGKLTKPLIKKMSLEAAKQFIQNKSGLIATKYSVPKSPTPVKVTSQQQQSSFNKDKDKKIITVKRIDGDHANESKNIQFDAFEFHDDLPPPTISPIKKIKETEEKANVVITKVEADVEQNKKRGRYKKSPSKLHDDSTQKVVVSPAPTRKVINGKEQDDDEDESELSIVEESKKDVKKPKKRPPPESPSKTVATKISKKSQQKDEAISSSPVQEDTVDAPKKKGRPPKTVQVTEVKVPEKKEENVSRTGRRRIRSTKLLDFVDSSNMDDD